MTKRIKVTYLKKAAKFLSRNHHALTEEEVDELIVRFIKKHFYGIDLNVDFKRLQGTLRDYYRIRKADIRIILRVVDNEVIIEAIVYDIGYRGDIYK